MQADQKRYKIINTTVKSPRVDPTTKRDMRSAAEKIGHAVSLRLVDGRSIIVTPQRPGIVPYIDEGMMKLVRNGMITIQEFGGLPEVLKEHTLQQKAQASAPAPQVERTVAHASEMGVTEERKTDSTEYEGAKNPDGNPNFVVTANKDATQTVASKTKTKNKASTQTTRDLKL